MSHAMVNLIFAVLWMIVTGAFSLPNFLLGLAFGAAALFLIREQTGSSGYFDRARRILSLIILFARELAVSVYRVARIVFKRDMDLKPGIFSYETSLTRDAEITLLANLITLTPGTLSVDVSPDGKTLYIHAVDCSDIDGARADIRNGFERKIRDAFA